MGQYEAKKDAIQCRNQTEPRWKTITIAAALFTLMASHGSCFAALSDYINEAEFDSYFSNHNSIFNFPDLSAAVAAYYPEFANTGTATQQAQELAAFLANAAQETDGSGPDKFDFGLYFSAEPCVDGCPQFSAQGYGIDGNLWTGAPGQSYQGRGALQLTYAYNYGPANAQLQLLDPTLPNIFDHPNLVTAEPPAGLGKQNMAWLSALWFWFTPQYSKPSCHSVMTGGWTPSDQDIALGRTPGFAMTEVIINGGVQCDVYNITGASLSGDHQLALTINRPNNTLLQGSLVYLQNANDAAYDGVYKIVSGTQGADQFTVVADAVGTDLATPRSLKGLPALSEGNIGGYFGYLTRERRIDWYNLLTGKDYLDVNPGSPIDCSTIVPYVPYLPG
jgi:basic endochitinase B